MFSTCNIVWWSFKPVQKVLTKLIEHWTWSTQIYSFFPFIILQISSAVLHSFLDSIRILLSVNGTLISWYFWDYIITLLRHETKDSLTKWRHTSNTQSRSKASRSHHFLHQRRVSHHFTFCWDHIIIIFPCTNFYVIFLMIIHNTLPQLVILTKMLFVIPVIIIWYIIHIQQ